MQTSMLHSNKVCIDCSSNDDSTIFTCLYMPMSMSAVFPFVMQQTRLCIGHYALPGVAAPSTKVAATRYLMLEATDTSTSRVLKSKQSNSLINQV